MLQKILVYQNKKIGHVQDLQYLEQLQLQSYRIFEQCGAKVNYIPVLKQESI